MKTITFLLFLIMSMLTTVSLIFPDEVSVKRQVTINAPIEQVYAQVRDLKSWNQWSGLVPMNNEFQLHYLNNEDNDLNGYSWQLPNDQQHKRSLQLTGTSWCDSISSTVSFSKDDLARICFHFHEKDGTTVVRWDFTTPLTGPIAERLKGHLIPQLIGPDLKIGLNKLKAISEEKYAAEQSHNTQLSVN